jgi:putative hemolysin
MAEIAIISSRKTRLQHMADEGNKGAQIALSLSQDPNKFISTLQLGITLVGIMAGVFGGATIADNLRHYFETISWVKPYSQPLAFGIVVAAITYFSLMGELIPKRLALINSERIASLVALPMSFFYSFTGPVVRFLSFTTDSILSLLRIDSTRVALVSEEEVQMLINEGAESGVFEEAEKDIIERTLRLDDKRASMLMTSRNEIIWIDAEWQAEEVRETLLEHAYSYFPVCRGSMDEIIGVVRSEELLLRYLSEGEVRLEELLHKPLFIPEAMDALSILELFKKSGVRVALVVDEYGGTQGLVSLNDILEAIVGDIPAVHDMSNQEIVARDDGSWLVDGLTSLDDFKDYFDVRRLTDEESGGFQTIGGYVMHELERIPVAGDSFELDDFR